LRAVYAAYTLEHVGYEWVSTLLAALVGIEPYEIRQVLEEGDRWPRPAVSDVGVRLLAVWGRTRSGRPLVVVLRPTGTALDWLIVGAVDMTPDQVAEFEGWEAGHER
jgi:hypothetical protein